MDKNKKKLRLALRRTIVCIIGAGVLSLLIFALTRGTGALMKITDAGAQAAQGDIPASSGPSAVSRPASSAAPPSSSNGRSASSVPAASSVLPASSAPASSAAPLAPWPAAGTAAPSGWFRDAVFIGDSRTEGLQNYDGLDGATYYAVKGLMVDTVYTKEAIREGSSKLTVMQALQRNRFRKVYVMLGVNELGWSSFATFIGDYGRMIDDIRKYEPGSEVYLQAILPVTAGKSASDSVYNNGRIKNSNDAIKKLAAAKQVTFLPVNEAVQDITGALPAEATVDGVHLNAAYSRKWCEYLKQHIE